MVFAHLTKRNLENTGKNCFSNSMSFTLEKIYSEMETLWILRISVLLLYLLSTVS
jgi:hypothetical protein